MPATPDSDPEAGIGACSGVQSTSSAAPWFIDAWVSSDSGASHFLAGKVDQACTNRSPQIPGGIAARTVAV